jgi:inhibitor of KinA sporulation pathway (predicted exonuclease)
LTQRATLSIDDVVRTLVAGEHRIVVVDVEATCWKKGVFSRKKETIEIGAVLLRLDRSPSSWPEFQTLVRPLRYPRLSTFCRELTGIMQEDVDAAPTFPEALRLFLEWSQPLERVALATWSHYDMWQLGLDLENQETARQLAPDAVLPRHRALADARRTARILRALLNRVGLTGATPESEGPPFHGG